MTRGPTPKDPSERRRRNVPALGEWIDITVPELEIPVLPDLAKLVATKSLTAKPNQRKALAKIKERIDFRYNDVARRTWEVWREDPITTYWTRADIEFALKTLELYNQDDWVDTKNMAEIRQRENQLGLTPEGKKKMRFRITFGVGQEASKEHKPEVLEQEDDGQPIGASVVQLDERRKRLTEPQGA